MRTPLSPTFLILAAFLAQGESMAGAGRIDRIPEGFPPLPEKRRAVYEYYNLAFLPDGFPGKEIEDGRVVPHPIYGTYIINDYLRCYRENKEERYLRAARRMADLSIARMERFEDALVFWYRPEDGLLYYPHRVYSSLTQSHYLLLFAQIYQLTGEKKYLEAAELVLKSLTIPTDRGGVLLRYGEDGAIMEEVPQKVPAAILNGWLSATLQVVEYWEITQSEEAKALYERNLKALTELLPVYDVPEVLNSRYRLSGFDYFRLQFQHGISGEIVDPKVVIPTVGSSAIGFDSGNRWGNYFMQGVDEKSGRMRIEGNRIQGNIVLSMISTPEPNRFETTIITDRATSVTLQLGDGQYDPLTTGLRVTGWVDIETVALRSGENRLSISIPWRKVRLVAYPTNFRKKVGGRFHNSYHFLHVISLYDLHRRTPRKQFRDYWEKWLGYTKQWAGVSPYKDADIRLDYYIPGSYGAFDPDSLGIPSDGKAGEERATPGP